MIATMSRFCLTSLLVGLFASSLLCQELYLTEVNLPERYKHDEIEISKEGHFYIEVDTTYHVSYDEGKTWSPTPPGHTFLNAASRPNSWEHNYDGRIFKKNGDVVEIYDDSISDWKCIHDFGTHVKKINGCGGYLFVVTSGKTSKMNYDGEVLETYPTESRIYHYNDDNNLIVYSEREGGEHGHPDWIGQNVERVYIENEDGSTTKIFEQWVDKFESTYVKGEYLYVVFTSNASWGAWGSNNLNNKYGRIHLTTGELELIPFFERYAGGRESRYLFNTDKGVFQLQKWGIQKISWDLELSIIQVEHEEIKQTWVDDFDKFVAVDPDHYLLFYRSASFNCQSS